MSLYKITDKKSSSIYKQQVTIWCATIYTYYFTAEPNLGGLYTLNKSKILIQIKQQGKQLLQLNRIQRLTKYKHYTY